MEVSTHPVKDEHIFEAFPCNTRYLAIVSQVYGNIEKYVVFFLNSFFIQLKYGYNPLKLIILRLSQSVQKIYLVRQRPEKLNLEGWLKIL